MKKLESSNLSLTLLVERVGLWARYLVYVVMSTAFFLGFVTGNIRDFIVLTVVVLLHNTFAHSVFLLKRYSAFSGKLNFFIYLAEATLITHFSGRESSDAYIAFHLLLIGLSAHTRRARTTALATFLCMVAYSGVVVLEWYRIGLALPWGVILFKTLSIGICGWLVAQLMQRFGSIEATVRRQAEDLAASENMLRTILDCAGEPILVFDDQEFITEANDQAAAFLAVAREKLLGNRIRAYLFDDGTLPHKFASLRARGEAQTEEVVVDAHGEERSVDIVYRSFMREGKRYYVALLHDITDRKNLQETTRLANQRLERLNAELRQIDRMKGDFLASISQNLRSPLSAVSGFVEMLLEEELGELNPDQRKALQTCRRGIIRAFKLVDEALDLHRLETKRAQNRSDSAAPAESGSVPPHIMP
ncbi:MAG: PAS domain S-box protein [Candidatus Hydrogenedentes bacterium]|nr:PAS domain S-box protein [Candidatus Hydrogenedentota bacterium]